MNTFAVYILPGVVSAFNVFVIRSFIDGIPYALQESAKLDGANDFTIYWRVILPLTKPALATISLFLAVGQWNAWFDTYLYNGSNESLTTLQYELMKVLQSTTAAAAGITGRTWWRPRSTKCLRSRSKWPSPSSSPYRFYWCIRSCKSISSKA
ncbi:L-arabinose transport system permease protein AraQ [Paenibacillus sp. P1XP2]|nr:L-arabinose transport system permease protein AraQ [Paenibacillus sp. P1XP2]